MYLHGETALAKPRLLGCSFAILCTSVLLCSFVFLCVLLLCSSTCLCSSVFFYFLLCSFAFCYAILLSCSSILLWNLWCWCVFLHELMGPMTKASVGGKSYIFGWLDDFSRFTCVSFLKEKSDMIHAFVKLCTQLQNERNVK